MAANFVLLERIELNASAASVTFSNIPQSGYTDLKIVISARTNRANAVDSLGFYFNGDATVARYTGRVLYGTGSTAASNAPSPVNDETMFVSGDSATASTFGNSELYIPNYTSSNQKSASVDSVGENNATTARMNIAAILYNQTTAISSITFIPITGTAIVANSTFSLYGLAAVGTTPVIAPKASGGNRIDYDGTYWIHTFTTSGTFVPQTGLTCDALVVAGGGSGGGGSGSAGGGGAGGFRTATGLSVAAQSYTVTVGAGGAGVGQNVNGNKGSDSVFSTITSTGGGYGAYEGQAGGSGGSGGGSSYTGTGAGAGNTPSTSPSQGNNGGNATTGASNYPGSGGGGAGAVGGNGSGSTGGAGGAGTANSYSGTSVTYAGGGGGGSRLNGGQGAGGSGGGGAGAGSSSVAATSGTVNTGGGGGGNTDAGTSTNSGSGGSGIVIIRYLAA